MMMPTGDIWNASGNVGLGTVNPQEALSVNGNIRSKEVKVETVNWPDYVFNSSYHLSGLKEVEDYIVQNHHLPEVPSSEQISKKGQNLGEMNSLLVKKIEELTLYMIALKKDNETLKQVQQIMEKKLKVHHIN